MKKFLSLILALIMCLSFVSVASAKSETEIQNTTVNEVQTVESNPVDELLPSDGGEELEKVISVVTKVVTYIYDYATQPEEPAVDLQTVITVVQIVITVICWIIQNYG